MHTSLIIALSIERNKSVTRRFFLIFQSMVKLNFDLTSTNVRGVAFFFFFHVLNFKFLIHISLPYFIFFSVLIKKASPFILNNIIY